MISTYVLFSILVSVCYYALSFNKIPRYIITLHELLAHTPHEHVERKSLEFAKSKLEELSRYVSELSASIKHLVIKS